MELTNNFELRTMAGEYVLMPQKDMLLTSQRPLVVNETLAFFIREIREGKTEDEIIKSIIKEYEVDYEFAKTQFDTMAETLERSKVVVKK